MEYLLQSTIYILIFFVGASIGSFLCCMAIRFNPNVKDIPKKMSRLSDSSACDICKRKLNIIDLIPVLGFVINKGRCRKCNESVSWEYLFIEILCGVLAVMIYMLLFPYMELARVVFLSIVIYLFIYLAYFDYLYWEVPLEVIEVAVGLSSIIYLTGGFMGVISSETVLQNFVTAIVGVFFIAFLIFVSRGRGLGWGDAWIMGLIGLVIGWKGTIASFFIAVFLGSLVGIARVLYKRTAFKGEIIQFVPFLTTGVIVILFDTNNLIFYSMFPVLL